MLIRPARLLRHKGEMASAFVQVVLWSFRLQQDAAGVKRDLTWILPSLFWFYRHYFASGILEAPSYIWVALWRLSLCTLFLLVLKCWRLYRRRASRPSSAGTGNDTPDGHSISKLKPLIFPCRTTHTRIFPRKHSFSYSYLFVGIPVGYQGSSESFISVGGGKPLLDEDEKTKHIYNTKSLFHIEAADYLSRGGNSAGLERKLHAYLRSQVSCGIACGFLAVIGVLRLIEQNEDPGTYPHAYLVTAPRFLGYSFNPVSFWYLYSGRGNLAAMILEVNNTFDEKRMYFLKRQENEHAQREDGDGIVKEANAEIDSLQDGSVSQNEAVSVVHPEAEPIHHSSSSTNFKTAWAKDFHVSPFNSRKGNYTLNAHDPFPSSFSSFKSSDEEGAIINNTITLTSSKQHAKLIARVFSTKPSLDPSSLGLMGEIKLVAGWWWVGFVTFPRILREAAKLFFLRKLHVWYRPEVLRQSIGRRETHDEK